jgi:hypothetical protein
MSLPDSYVRDIVPSLALLGGGGNFKNTSLKGIVESQPLPLLLFLFLVMK